MPRRSTPSRSKRELILRFIEEQLEPKQFQALIEAYIFSEQEPLREDIFQCLANRPSVLQAKRTGQRIVKKMKEFIAVFSEQQAV